jgi:hypothetical protein
MWHTSMLTYITLIGMVCGLTFLAFVVVKEVISLMGKILSPVAG